MSAIGDLIANSGGITGAFNKYSPVGTTVQGQITSADVQQVHDFDSGKPLVWDDGSPQQQLRVVVQTGQIDPSIEGDDGRRAIYVKWWGDQRKALLDAVKAAGDNDVREGGMFRATFTGTKPNEKNPRLNDIKLYSYAYQKPAPGSGLDMGGGENAPQQQQQQQAPQAPQAPQQAPQGGGWNAPANDPWATNPPAQQQAPQQFQQQAPAGQDQAAQQAFQQGLDAQQIQQQQAPQQQAPAGGGADIDRIKQFIALGMSDAEVAGALGMQPEQVAAVRNLA